LFSDRKAEPTLQKPPSQRPTEGRSVTSDLTLPIDSCGCGTQQPPRFLFVKHRLSAETVGTTPFHFRKYRHGRYPRHTERHATLLFGTAGRGCTLETRHAAHPHRHRLSTSGIGSAYELVNRADIEFTFYVLVLQHIHSINHGEQIPQARIP
jgi:hypothetical protein